MVYFRHLPTRGYSSLATVIGIDTHPTYGHDMAMGEVIGLGQLRSDACGYLERVVRGETLEVVRRGTLVARIVPATNDRLESPTDTPPVEVIARNLDGPIRLDDLRTRAGRYFDRVAAGQTVEIAWRGGLVARIVAVPDSNEADCRPVKIAARDPGGRIGLTELRTRGGQYFKRVAAGETVEVARRGRLIARIVSAKEEPLGPT